jgi:DNA-binding GntR family transcriptional regulator
MMSAAADRDAGEQVIARTSLHDELTARLRDLIDAGELAPGARVPEKALCERFGVSRTPLREALKVLAVEGLVELLPQRGARVALLTAADVEAMFPVIGALEALAGELACARIDDAGIAAIETLHRRMCSAYRKRDRSGYFALNRQIHESILEATGNPVLIATYRGLAGRIRNARYVAAMSPAQWRTAIEQHQRILAALRQRDGSTLARLLRAHLAEKCATVRAALAAQPLEI